MNKNAKIFGGATHDSGRANNAAIPYSGRRREYVLYLNKKSKESPTKLVTALLTGAGLGGLTGGLAGLPLGGKSGALAGILLGALGGSFFGLFTKAIDDGNIQEAKRILRKGHIDQGLGEAIMRNQRAKEQVARNRHSQTQRRLSGIEKGVSRIPGYPRRSRRVTVKVGSLCSKIAGTLNESDFERFNEVFSDSNTRRMIEKNASVMECLTLLTDSEIHSTDKMASAAASAFTMGYDVVQVRPSGYGYTVKVSAAPQGVAPQETQMTQQQAQQALPPEMLQAADQQGAGTVTNVQADPDPLAEKMAPATGFGLYKVTDATSGKQVVGYVIPGLFDPVSGQPSQVSLFTNGSAYCVQPVISGSLLGVNFNLPIPENPEVRGLGVFVKNNEKAIIATMPYNIITKVTVEGKGYFAAQDMQGNDIRIIPSEGIAKPVATSATEIVIPADYKFMPLENPIQLAGGEELMKSAQANAFHTMMELRAWSGGCRLDGPVFEKVGSGEHDWADGVFWMAAAGVPQNVGSALLEKAASTGEPVRLFGLAPLSTREEYVAEAEKEAMVAMSDVEIPQRVNLLKEIAAVTFSKEAAALVDTVSVDAVLSLNFLNPENVETFVEHLPQLEHASEKLANIVLASQLGLQSISKTAAVRAMFALEDVISGLKSLKTYSV